VELASLTADDFEFGPVGVDDATQDADVDVPPVRPGGSGDTAATERPVFELNPGTAARAMTSSLVVRAMTS